MSQNSPTDPDAPVPATPQTPRQQSELERFFGGIRKWVQEESAATQALVSAVLAVGIAFQWWHWTDAQTGAVVGITAALLSMFVRSQVTPTSRLPEEVRKNLG